MKNLNGETIKFLDDNGFYPQKSIDDIKVDYDFIISMWQAFLIAQKEKGLKPGKDYYIHKRNLFEVIKRLDKRRTYYYVFHRIDKICEYKSIAILCYWINTLKPFMVVKEDSKIYNCPNEMFSLYIIMSTIARIYEEYYPNQKFEFLDKKSIQDYVYNFKYCDLSRESTIFFVETLARSYGVGMEKIGNSDT